MEKVSKQEKGGKERKEGKRFWESGFFGLEEKVGFLLSEIYVVVFVIEVKVLFGNKNKIKGFSSFICRY